MGIASNASSLFPRGLIREHARRSLLFRPICRILQQLPQNDQKPKIQYKQTIAIVFIMCQIPPP